MSSVSDALAALGKTIDGALANPGSLNSWLRSHGGYYGNLFVWGSVAPFGLTYQGQPSNKQTLSQYTCDGKHIVILNVNNGGHWVLATGCSDNNQSFFVNDPGYSRTSYSFSEVGVAGVFTY